MSAEARPGAYRTGSDPAIGFDPEAVLAFVSRALVYVLDAELRVVAYRHLSRRSA